MVFTSKLPTIEELVYKIKNEKDNDLNINIDNNDIRNDLKKILDIFPKSKLIKNNYKEKLCKIWGPYFNKHK